MDEHVATFTRILESTRCKKLHEWNIEALQRAWDWACFFEKTVKKEAENDRESLSSKSQYCRDLLNELVSSPYLLTHPLRQGMFNVICTLYEQTDGGSNALASDIVDCLETYKTTQILTKMAQLIEKDQSPLSFTLAGTTIELHDFTTWQLQNRTMLVAALAHALQAQIISQELNDMCKVKTFYNENNENIHGICMEQDIVVYCAVVLNWPVQAKKKHHQLLNIIVESLKTLPSTYLSIHPWLAAKFCHLYPEFIQEYVSTIITYAIDSNDKLQVHFKERLGSLVYNNQQLLTACESSLLKLDSTSLSVLLQKNN
ncbi:hypothetical protein THRCLA_02453 [Thraustotheca clavata]|uniref:Uncharacterized protein n=1 Tax=Thraustotheca clavata TaxID=74557 RepID=A0A1W0A5B8_9STRA|nr:hypothetical protein THRCLA_02453 [Thraustotheca clavata]